MTAQEAITMLRRIQEPEPFEPQINEAAFEALQMAIEALGKDTNVPGNELVSRQAREYAKAVFVWLLDYQIKAAELKGRYTPYEVLSWVANDWRKEHE